MAENSHFARLPRVGCPRRSIFPIRPPGGYTFNRYFVAHAGRQGAVVDERILDRKQEVAPEELRRQRVAYADLAGMLPNSTVVRTDQNFEVSSSEATAAILKHLAQRFEYRERKRLEHALSPTTPDRTKSEDIFLPRRVGSDRSSRGNP